MFYWRWLAALVIGGGLALFLGQRNWVGVQLLGQDGQWIERWYMVELGPEVVFVPAGCHYANFLRQYNQAITNHSSPMPRFDCPAHPLANVWAARQFWQQGQVTQACAVWWPMNNMLDPFQAAQFSLEAQQWSQLAETLACLEHWREREPAEWLINGIYGGWVATLYGGLAEHNEQSGQLASALAAYRQAMVWEPVSDWGYGLAAGRLLVDLHRLAEALALIDRLLAESQIEGDQYALSVNWADFLASQHYVNEAVPFFAAAAGVAPAGNNYPCDRLKQLAPSYSTPYCSPS